MPPRRSPPRQKRVKTRRGGRLGDALALVGDGHDRPHPSSDGPTVTVTVPSPWRRAFSTRLPTTCWNLSGSTHISGSSPCDATTKRLSGSPAATRPATALRDDGRQVDDLLAHLEPAGVDAADVEQLGDQPGDAVGVGVDRLEHELLLLVVEAVPLGEQGRGEALDAGQRRAQLVRDGRDEVGAAALDAARARGCRAGTTTRRASRRSGVADVGRRDQQVAAAVEAQLALGLAGAAGQPAVRVGAGPPVAALVVGERQDVAVVAAERGVGGGAEQPLGGRVEGDDHAVGVGDDEAVRQVVVDRLLGCAHWPLLPVEGGTLSGRSAAREQVAPPGAAGCRHGKAGGSGRDRHRRGQRHRTRDGASFAPKGRPSCWRRGARSLSRSWWRSWATRRGRARRTWRYPAAADAAVAQLDLVPGAWTCWSTTPGSTCRDRNMP